MERSIPIFRQPTKGKVPQCTFEAAALAFKVEALYPWLRSDVTRLLGAMDAGDPKAGEQLLPLVYEELRKLPASYGQ